MTPLGDAPSRKDANDPTTATSTLFDAGLAGPVGGPHAVGGLGASSALHDEAATRDRDAAALWSIAVFVPARVVQGQGHQQSGPDPEPAPAHDGVRVVSPAAGADTLIADFVRGYRDADGKPEYERHFVEDVIPCESGWQIDPNSPVYFGLGQFVWSSWVAARRSPDADWRDPYEQGFAIAVNARDNDPARQWPTCWHRGGW